MIDQEGIKKVIPQREPFLFVDEITAVHPDGVDATFAFRADSEFFKGHFPDSPIVPGVLMVEALAQTGAYFLLSDPENEGKNALLLSVNQAKFKAMVKPDEVCVMQVRQKTKRFGLASCTAQLFVRDKVAVSCELMCMLVDKQATNS